MGFATVLRRRDELPDETLDVLISAVMEQAKYQDDAADRLHVALAQSPFTPGVGEDVPPATPSGEEKKGSKVQRVRQVILIRTT